MASRCLPAGGVMGLRVPAPNSARVKAEGKGRLVSLFVQRFTCSTLLSRPTYFFLYLSCEEKREFRRNFVWRLGYVRSACCWLGHDNSIPHDFPPARPKCPPCYLVCRDACVPKPLPLSFAFAANLRSTTTSPALHPVPPTSSHMAISLA